MRVVRVVLESLFIIVALSGVTASSAINIKDPPRAISTESVLLRQNFPGHYPTGTGVVRPAVGERRVAYDGFTTPPRRARTAGDFWLMILVAITLVGHQMRRKHRFLRPHPFGF